MCCECSIVIYIMSSNIPTNCKKQLYISLIRSHFMYCSVIWRPCLIKHIQLIERVQRRATKYILNDYISDYKSRLIKLQILPLAYILELNDIMFFIRNLKHPHEGFNINNYISFASGDTRTSANHKLQHNRSSTNTMNNFYFNRLPRLWNALPVINPALDTLVIKHKLSQYLWNNFNSNFNSDNICTYSFACICSKCSQHPTANNLINNNYNSVISL